MKALNEHAANPCIVHRFCNSQGITILHNDSGYIMGSTSEKVLTAVDEGSSWCDEGFKNIHHFYHPKTGKGILGLNGADQELMNYYSRAIKSFNNKSMYDFWFFIGSSLHIIQDMCVPHHAAGKLLNGHREYEEWVAQYHYLFSVDSDAKYHYRDPLDILKDNALKALEHDELLESNSIELRTKATCTLLSLAQRSTASFLYLIRNTLSISEGLSNN